MKKKARSYSVDFKQEAVRRMAQATTMHWFGPRVGHSTEAALPVAGPVSGGRQGWSGATPRPTAGK